MSLLSHPRRTARLAAALAGALLLAGPARAQETPPPSSAAPAVKNPRVVLEIRGLHYDAGDPVLVRVSAHNDGPTETANPLTDPVGRGFVLTEAGGKAHRPAGVGDAAPSQRPARLAPGAYFGRVMDLAPLFPVLSRPGTYTLGYGTGDDAAEPVTLNIIEEYNPTSSYMAVIKTPAGEMKIELFREDAPLTVRNFVDLARQGFYNGLPFHYVRPGDMLMGGDPSGEGFGGSGFNVPAEFNSRKHLAGTVGMVRGADPNSASSQFYICLAPQPERDGRFTVFGQVVEGMEVLNRLGETPTSGRSKRPFFRPLEPLVMESVQILEQKASAPAKAGS